MNRCEVCGDTNEHVDAIAMRYQEGDEIAFASSLRICRTCRHLIVRGKSSELARRLSPDYEDWEPGAVASLLVSRAVAAAPPADNDVAESASSSTDFERLEDHTGLTEELAPLWPGEHRAQVVDTRQPPLIESGILWLVRSPWPRLSVSEVLWILSSWVERDPYSEDKFSARVAEVFGWSEAEALDRLAAEPMG